MDNTMKRLAALLALALCLNAAAFAVAEGDAQDVPEQNDAIVEQAEESAPAPEAPKAEAPKAEAPKQEAPKAEEKKPEEPKSEATQAPEQKETPREQAPDEEAAATPDASESVKEPTSAPKAEATPAPAFSAKVRIKLVGRETVAFGDRVTLRADVEEANGDYGVKWQFFNEEADIEKGEDPWVTFEEGTDYTFEVARDNIALTYRVVLYGVELDGKVTSRTFTLRNMLEKDKAAQEPEDGEDAEAEEMPGEDADDDDDADEEIEGEEPDGEETESDDVIGEATPGEAAKDENDSAEEPNAPAEPEDDMTARTAERSVSITADWGEGALYFGGEATLTAVLGGYDDVACALQWQTSKDGEEWADVEGATEQSYVMTVTEDNYRDFWRVIVTVAADEE